MIDPRSTNYLFIGLTVILFFIGLWKLAGGVRTLKKENELKQASKERRCNPMPALWRKMRVRVGLIRKLIFKR